jgi:hypothetical protein
MIAQHIRPVESDAASRVGSKPVYSYSYLRRGHIIEGELGLVGRFRELHLLGQAEEGSP